MIGTIKLSYKHNAAISNAVVSTFFKTAGIHVVENCYDEPINLREELAEYQIEPILNTTIISDVEIILTDRLDDKQLNGYINIDDIIIRLNYNKVPKTEKGDINKEWLINEVLSQIEEQRLGCGNLVKINCSELKDEHGYIDESKLINEILNQLSQGGLLSKQQESYLRELAEVIISEDYIRTSLLSSSDFALDIEQKQLFIEKQRQFVTKVREIWKKNEENIHAKYALINAGYETNRLCRNSRLPQIYNFREISAMANEIKDATGGMLDRSVQMLLVQNEILTCYKAEAYYRITNSLKNENRFNPLAYRVKGQYFLREEDYERAIRHFKASIALYPEDYKSWHDLGLCLREMNSKSGTVRRAFLVVIKILDEKSKINFLTPVESRYLYEATFRVGKLLENDAAFRVALDYYGTAKRVLESLNDSHFIKYLNMKKNNEDKIRLINQLNEGFTEEDLNKKLKLCKSYLGL